jgi:hypothetical protein
MKSCLLEQMILLKTALASSLDRIAIVILSFLMPINGILLTIGISIFLDTVVGIWKSKKQNIKITSRKLSQIVSKTLLYEATVILFFMIDSFMLNEIVQTIFSVPFLLTKIVALTLVSIEIFSVDENIKAVKKTGLFYAFKNLVARSKEVKDDIDKIK